MKYISTMVLMVFSLQVFAGGFSTPADAKKFTDKTVELFYQMKFKEGLNAAKAYWPLPEVEIDSLGNQINQQWPLVQQRFGQPTGIEFIRSEKIANSFVRYYYLHKFQNHAIYWRFDFYKPNNQWKINSIVFLDDLNMLYE